MRYITIKGSVKAVTLVVSIFWELIALEEKELNLGPRNIWIPQPHMSHLFDNDHVEARLVVPAKTVGRIIGKDMTTIKVHEVTVYWSSLPVCISFRLYLELFCVVIC